MARQQSIIASLDRLDRVQTVDFDQLPPAELLAEYRDLYADMTKRRRARAFSSHDPLHQADRERARTERRVMTMANAVHRRSRAVSVDLHEARDRGPEAVLAAIELAIERHDALTLRSPSLARRAFSNRRRLWITAAAASAAAVLVAAAAQLA